MLKTIPKTMTQKEFFLHAHSLKIALIGFGVEGQSTLKYLLKHNVLEQNIVIFDQNPPQVSESIRSFSGPDSMSFLNQEHFDYVIRSAGVHPHKPEIVEYVKKGGRLTSQVELFFDWCPAPIIGITGTMGKGTTTSMIEAVLIDQKRSHFVGGNIGIAVLDMLDQLDSESLALLELSSFQTYNLRKSPDIAVILQVTSEHLDWHSDTQDYRNAKANLATFQSKDQVCVYFADSEGSLECVKNSQAQKLSFGAHGDIVIQDQSLVWNNKTYALSNFAVQGLHQLQNLSAAALVCSKLNIPQDEIIESLQKFGGLSMRLEKVGESNSTQFINDSYATRPEATQSAIQSFAGQNLYLILGGSEKNADFNELAEICSRQNNMQGIYLIGFTAERLANILKEYQVIAPQFLCATLQDAFLLANQHIEKSACASSQKSVLLLSPACASFGLFKNYKERGYVFNQLVQDHIQSAQSENSL
jgi:UDP-N-acetylmuramoylalanine--D-glutamate ligase